LRFTGKFFFKKGSKSGEIRYSDVVFKHMTTEF
jgi:hypothetical protein